LIQTGLETREQCYRYINDPAVIAHHTTEEELKQLDFFRRAYEGSFNGVAKVQDEIVSLRNTSAERLRELFPDYQFHQTTFPEPDDFINMQARYAFCRMERADNVTAFRTVAPPDPTPGTRGQILNAMRERHADRKKAQPPPRPQQPRPAQAEPSRKSKARILKTPDVKKPPKSKNKSTGELSF